MKVKVKVKNEVCRMKEKYSQYLASDCRCLVKNNRRLDAGI
jgi:hypothetical protein